MQREYRPLFGCWENWTNLEDKKQEKAIESWGRKKK